MSRIRILKCVIPCGSLVYYNNNNNNYCNNVTYNDKQIQIQIQSQKQQCNIIHETYQANDPIEDRVCILANKQQQQSSIRAAAAIFDGHGGDIVADFASKNLLPLLLQKLNDNNNIDDSILSSFNDIENEYIKGIKQAYAYGYGEVAKVGCCALIAIVNDNNLTIANCGDCRAVLGSNINSNTVATRLSRDHNARMSLEQINLQTLHPNEDDIVKCKNPHACYVKGRLQLTRALGDLYLKYSSFNAPSGLPRVRGRHIPEPFTPPYVSPIPEINHFELDSNDKFIILATDGVWDFLTDAEAVKIVAACGKDESQAANALVNATLERASLECGMTKIELMALPAGRKRRSRHDDTTAIVIYL